MTVWLISGMCAKHDGGFIVEAYELTNDTNEPVVKCDKRRTQRNNPDAPAGPGNKAR